MALNRIAYFNMRVSTVSRKKQISLASEELRKISHSMMINAIQFIQEIINVLFLHIYIALCNWIFHYFNAMRSEL